MNDEVMFHELECWGYDADLPMWRALAAEFGGPVVDLGAGTGRVSLDLAEAGYDVIAVDLDPVLLAELTHPRIRTVTADIRELALDTQVPLVVIPMQTVQLLGGADGRAALLTALRGVLVPGGVVAAAIAEHVEPYSSEEHVAFVVVERDGVRYESDPFAIIEDGDAYVLHHARIRHDPDGTEHSTVQRTHRLDATTLEAEAEAAGLRVLPRRVVGQTDEHVGSTVVMLGG